MITTTMIITITVTIIIIVIMRPSKGVFDVALSLVCQPICRLFGKGQMSLSLFRFNTIVAVVFAMQSVISMI